MDDIIIIKRLRLIYLKSILKIISDNPKYEIKEVYPDHIIIDSKVIWFGSDIEG